MFFSKKADPKTRNTPPQRGDQQVGDAQPAQTVGAKAAIEHSAAKTTNPITMNLFIVLRVPSTPVCDTEISDAKCGPHSVFKNAIADREI